MYASSARSAGRKLCITPAGWKGVLAACLVAAGMLPQQRVSAQTVSVPPAPREFRGLWVATVSNIDWPSSRELSADAQKAELINILERARHLKMNAIVFQVRPACDAFYKSELEPWSAYLTGSQGKAPEPFYDPLEFVVEEAHKRGMELHAWFNPYRAGVGTTDTVYAENHISRRRPDLVHKYGNFLWLEPGEKEVQDYSLSVIMDVVRRYNIDAVHFDDYFYPYAAKDSVGRIIPFPDEKVYKKYKDAGGNLSLDNWRQKNVNDFVQRVSAEIKAEKPLVKFGISPFGIWRPGHPAGVIGLDSVKELNADSRLWWREGWVDYLVPQLYWKMKTPGHAYEELLTWWASENIKGRHLYAGNAAHNLAPKANSWTADEIVNQISFTRQLQGTFGNVFFNTRAFMQDYAEIVATLATGPYAGYALLPPSPWLDGAKPSAPSVATQPGTEPGSYTVRWQPRGNKSAFVWAVYAYIDGTWRFEVVPGDQTSVEFNAEDGSSPTMVAVAAVDRVGNESDRAIASTGAAGDRPLTASVRNADLPVLYSGNLAGNAHGGSE